MAQRTYFVEGVKADPVRGLLLSGNKDHAIALDGILAGLGYFLLNYGKVDYHAGKKRGVLDDDSGECFYF
jgi:hypothetical protein